MTGSQNGERADVVEPPAEELAKLFDEHRGEISLWMGFVRDAFAEVASADVRRAIHSVSGRLKDRDHLISKIDRKRKEARERKEARRIHAENLFEEVEDLGGVRVLTLYRWDLPTLDAFIRSAQCWTLRKGPDAYAGSEDDERKLREAGFQPIRRPDKKYTSIHYLVAPGGDVKPWMKCEIQVRGLHLEGWSEVDHQLRYPERDPGPFATRILEALHSATVLTDWLAEFARDADRFNAERRQLQDKMQQVQKELEDLKAKTAARPDFENDVARANVKVQELSTLLTQHTASFEHHFTVSPTFQTYFNQRPTVIVTPIEPPITHAVAIRKCAGCGVPETTRGYKQCPECLKHLCEGCYGGDNYSADRKAWLPCNLCKVGR
jgi:putative GTP pyrophosphokinase